MRLSSRAISLAFPPTLPSQSFGIIKTIQRELPIDLLQFHCLTPLPRSEDHQKLYKAGVAMDPDLNKYDLEHVSTSHPVMSTEQWEQVYRDAWTTYYSPEHFETVLRRAAATGINAGNMLFLPLWYYGCIALEKVHPLQGGYLHASTERIGARRYRWRAQSFSIHATWPTWSISTPSWPSRSGVSGASGWL